MPTKREIAEWQVAQIRDLLEKFPSDPVIIADYFPAEFAELKPDEDYAEYLAIRQIVIDRLGEYGIVNRVILHPVDSVKYYQFLAEQKIEHDSKAIAYFANMDYWKNNKNKKETQTMYITIDREAGNFIDAFNTMEEAVAAIKNYEEEDRKNGTFTPDFYEAIEVEADDKTYGKYLK